MFNKNCGVVVATQWEDKRYDGDLREAFSDQSRGNNCLWCSCNSNIIRRPSMWNYLGIPEQIQLSTYNMPESYYFEKQINFQHLVIKCKSETNQKLIANTSTGPLYGFALWFCYLFPTKIIYADNLVGIFLVEFLLWDNRTMRVQCTSRLKWKYCWLNFFSKEKGEDTVE